MTEKNRMEQYNKAVPWDPIRSTPVFITDVDIPFGSLAVLMVKLVVASVPAIVVAGIIYGAILFTLAVLAG